VDQGRAHRVLVHRRQFELSPDSASELNELKKSRLCLTTVLVDQVADAAEESNSSFPHFQFLERGFHFDISLFSDFFEKNVSIFLRISFFESKKRSWLEDLSLP
jgi:hypothetical protein